MSQSVLRFFIVTAIILVGTIRSNGQNETNEVFKEGTIPEQLKYLDEKTRIYEGYRAIREDMFRTISRNTIDTLAKAKKRINDLILHTGTLNNRIDSLFNSLETAKTEVKEMTRTKNSIRVLGLEVNKATYNSITWTILAILALLLVIGYLSYKRNRIITVRTKKDLNELKDEYEKYQTKTRLDREKMSIEHFNEIKKLKSGLPNRG